jgi:hypothetical protein
VVSGEVLIDHDNRARLEQGEGMHPLLRRILQIHVTEEARHVSFAKSYLRDRFPRLPALVRAVLGTATPRILRRGASMMLEPHPAIVERYAIPRVVLKRAFGPGTAHRETVNALVQPFVALMRDDYMRDD